jgi:hypothetical protein
MVASSYALRIGTILSDVSGVLFLAPNDNLDTLRTKPREQAVHCRETVGARRLRDEHF